MLVFGGIYLILGCCAAAWEKKMKDTQNYIGGYKRKGAAASASVSSIRRFFALYLSFFL